MKQKLRTLAHLLLRDGFFKEAQKINEWAEDWHQEAVKEFGEEPISEDEYLKEQIDFPPTFLLPRSKDEPIFKSNKEIEQEKIAKFVFDQLQIHPISTRGYAPGLGRGDFGKVYRVVYQGKSAAAKLIIGSYQSPEPIKWRKILERSKTFPADLKKHIPQVYLIQEGSLPESLTSTFEVYNLVKYFSVIVMEELLPLNRHLQKLLLKFPGAGVHEYQVDKAKQLMTPETKGFVEMLIALRDAGIIWDDFHLDNVMRDRDGNLKIIDVGQYMIVS